MERSSVIVVMCLLAGLSQCQPRGEDNQDQITEQAHKELADTWVENDAPQNLNQELETSTMLTANSTTTQPNCEPPIYTVLKELGALEERLAATIKALEETNKKLEASETKLSLLKSEVTELSQVDRGHPRVAFSASYPTSDTIGPVNVLFPLVYKHIVYNTGGHYSQVTGYFTAPVRGVYYFTFSSFSWGGDGSSGGSLYQNENPIVSWYGYAPSHAFSGSNSAIMLLQVGDYVNVRLWHNRVISDNGHNYCSFSGFLLFPV